MRRNGRRGPAVVMALAALALAAACHPAKAAPVLAPGAHGPAVRDLQARLAQLGLFRRNPTGRYATETATAVRTFQHQAGLPATGTYTTADRTALTSRTRKPHHNELHHTRISPTRHGNFPHSRLFPDRSDN